MFWIHSPHLLAMKTWENYLIFNACYKFDVLFFQTSCLNLISVSIFECETFGKWLDHEGEVLTNEISTLMKETSESSLIPSTMWRHSKNMAIYPQRSRPPLDTKYVNVFNLNIPASRSVRNKCLLFKLPILSNYRSLKNIKYCWRILVYIMAIRTTVILKCYHEN